jgi:ApaG protein
VTSDAQMRSTDTIPEPIDGRYHIRTAVQTRYLPEQSEPERNRFVFAYTITLTNEGSIGAQLISRHWIITDGEAQVQEVKGEGVVGEQPHLSPGKSYRYSSGTILGTEVGTMQGSYQMVSDDGTRFDALIAPFTLARPHALH